MTVLSYSPSGRGLATRVVEGRLPANQSQIPSSSRSTCTMRNSVCNPCSRSCFRFCSSLRFILHLHNPSSSTRCSTSQVCARSLCVTLIAQICHHSLLRPSLSTPRTNTKPSSFAAPVSSGCWTIATSHFVNAAVVIVSSWSN